MEMIAHIIICSLAIFGIWNLFNPGFIFGGKINTVLEVVLPDFVYKPLMGCHVCMASVWGSAYYFLFVGFDIGVVVFVCAVSGLNLFAKELLP
jgi:hypothetical protein